MPPIPAQPMPPTPLTPHALVELAAPQGAEWILVALLVGLPLIVVVGVVAALITVLRHRR